MKDVTVLKIDHMADITAKSKGWGREDCRYRIMGDDLQATLEKFRTEYHGQPAFVVQAVAEQRFLCPIPQPEKDKKNWRNSDEHRARR
jgi:hypothetical protein